MTSLCRQSILAYWKIKSLSPLNTIAWNLSSLSWVLLLSFYWPLRHPHKSQKGGWITALNRNYVLQSHSFECTRTGKLQYVGLLSIFWDSKMRRPCCWSRELYLTVGATWPPCNVPRCLFYHWENKEGWENTREVFDDVSSPRQPCEARCESTNLDVRGVHLHAWWLGR